MEREQNYYRLNLKNQSQPGIRKKQKKMMILQEISYCGLWQSGSQTERNLATFKGKSDKVDALKAHLCIRKVILQQPPPSTHDKSVYNFTVVGSQGKGKEFTVTELTENVKVLVQAAADLAQRNPIREADPVSWQGIKHKFEGDTWYDGEVISQVPGYPAWYSVVYDGDNSVYTYQLRTDLQAGDLIIQ